MDSYERDYKYFSPPAVIVIAIMSIIGGYFFGWYVNQEKNTYAFLIAIILFITSKAPIKIWNTWENYVTKKRIEESLSAREEKVERDRWKETTEAKIRRKLESQFKKSSPVGLFNNNDFDAETQTILMNLVVKSKRNPLKVVTKRELLDSVLLEHYLPKGKKVA